MKKIIFAALGLIIFSSAQLAQAQSGKVSNTRNDKTGKYWAKEGDTVWVEGDTVWVIINHIKPDKRQQFEKFITEILWPASKSLSSQDQLIFSQTRVLTPVQPEADGTYSYIFIMDPLVSVGDYSIRHLLGSAYDQQKAIEYEATFFETAARHQTWYQVIQYKYWKP